MDEIKMLNVTDIEQIITKNFLNTIRCDWYGAELYIKKTLSLDDMVSFIDKVSDASFDDNGKYDPRMTDISFRVCTIAYYSNVEIPDDADDIFDVLYASDLYTVITENIDQGQINDIRAAINAKINYRIEVDIDRILSDLEQFEDAINMVRNIFDGINAEDVSAALSAFTNSDVNQEEIINAYIKTIKAQEAES